MLRYALTPGKFPHCSHNYCAGMSPVTGERVGKPVILATGASEIGEVQRAVQAILKINSQLVLMQCNTNYTGTIENIQHVHLRVLETYKTMFPGLILGPRMADMLALVGRDTQLRRVATTHGGEWAGPCPFCGGRDRFQAKPCPPFGSAA